MRSRSCPGALAESLGGVESLVEVPQAMTHQSVEGSTAELPAASCGCPAASRPEDLVGDLRQALAVAAAQLLDPADHSPAGRFR
jgi:cystathionine beta-lyase/cystathionine gamma-synthase